MKCCVLQFSGCAHCHERSVFFPFSFVDTRGIETTAGVRICKFVGVWSRHLRVFIESLRQSSDVSENVWERSPGLRNNLGNSSESRQKTPSSVCLSTAVSRKVVLQTRKSSRDNVESLLFNGGLGVSRLFVLSPSLLLNYQSLTLTIHNTIRHCHVRFCTFVGQPLSKRQ